MNIYIKAATDILNLYQPITKMAQQSKQLALSAIEQYYAEPDSRFQQDIAHSAFHWAEQMKVDDGVGALSTMLMD